MPELRKDPIIGRWIIISSERSKRPTSFGPVSERKAANLCPFCPGHEENTPPEIISYRDSSTDSNKPGWNLRVIPNKYPALMVEGNVENESYGLYERMNGIGAHEVIIETPVHVRDIADMTEKEVNDILRIECSVRDLIRIGRVIHRLGKKIGFALVQLLLLIVHIHLTNLMHNSIRKGAGLPHIIKCIDIIAHKAARLPFSEQIRDPFQF